MRAAANYTAAADNTAQRFGTLLSVNAASYEEQERASAAALGGGSVPNVGFGTNYTGLPAPQPGSASTGVPAGEVPAGPRDISRLIHSGPGATGMQFAADLLRVDADRLEAAAGALAFTMTETRGAWTSDSSELATGRFGDLHGWYLGHADYVRGLAGELDIQAGHFQRARAAIPTVEAVDDAERELQVASAANQRANGRFSVAVAQAQAKLGRIYEAATTGYGNYTIATSAVSPRMPAPPPSLPPAMTVGEAPPQPAPGNTGTVKQLERSPSSDPTDPVGPGPGLDDVTAGPARSAATDPATDPPLIDPVLDQATEAVPAAAPAVIGGIVGGIGGALGGLAGAGQRALGSMQQAAAPMLSGLEAPGGGEPGGGEPGEPEAPQVPHMPGGHGGGTPGGGTEPSGGGGLAAPSGGGLGATPAAAAPVAAPATPVTSTVAPDTGPGGVPMGGAMMPPIMPGRGGASGSEADRRLYEPRRLRVVAPPNSEPVKGRREARRPAQDRKDEP